MIQDLIVQKGTEYIFVKLTMIGFEDSNNHTTRIWHLKRDIVWQPVLGSSVEWPRFMMAQLTTHFDSTPSMWMIRLAVVSEQ